MAAGNVAAVCNDWGSAYAMAKSQKANKAGQTFMLFGCIRGPAGHMIGPWVDRRM